MVDQQRRPRKRRRASQDAQTIAIGTARTLFEEGAQARDLSPLHPYTADVLRFNIRIVPELPDVGAFILRVELEASPVTRYHGRLTIGVLHRDGSYVDVFSAADDGQADVPPRVLEWPEEPALQDAMHRLLFTALGRYPYGPDDPDDARQEVH